MTGCLQVTSECTGTLDPGGGLFLFGNDLDDIKKRVLIYIHLKIKQRKKGENSRMIAVILDIIWLGAIGAVMVLFPMLLGQ